MKRARAGIVAGVLARLRHSRARLWAIAAAAIVAGVLAAGPALAQTSSIVSALPAGSAIASSDDFYAEQGTCPGSPPACNGVHVTGTQLLTWAHSGLAAVATSGSAADLTTGILPAARLPNPGASSLGGVQSFAAVSHQFLTQISTAGVVSAARPACADLSDSAASCSTDATNANNLTAGVLAAARGGAGTITGALKANGSGLVSQAAAADLSNGVTGSGLVALATSPSFTTPQLGVATATTLAGKNALSSITVGAAAQVGTGATAACAASHVCDSVDGEVALTTGTGTLTGGTLFTLNFADTRTNLANCQVSQNTQGAAGSLGKLLWTPTTSTLAFGSGGTPVASTAYVFDYHCFGN